MKQRILTAIISLIIIVPIIIYGQLPFIIAVYFMATVGLYELIRMFSPKQVIPQLIATIPFLWLLIYPKSELTFVSLTVSKFDIIVLFAIIILATTVFSKNKFTYDDSGLLMLGVIYLGTAFYGIILLRETGLVYLLFVLIVIWTTDSGAYFSGRAFGNRKLWPDISPNKTIGGAIGGLILAIIIGTIYHVLFPLHYTLTYVIVIAGIISLVAQLGDLVASAIKRNYKVKDSGSIFPGHGGILDRLDSLLFVVLVLYCLQFIS